MIDSESTILAGALNLLPLVFLLDAGRARLGQRLVELRQAGDDDVLAAVERAGVLLFFVLRERELALLDELALAFDLAGQPLGALLEALDLQPQILRDVFFGEGVDGPRGKLRIGRVERHVHELAAADLVDVEVVRAARRRSRRSTGDHRAAPPAAPAPR